MIRAKAWLIMVLVLCFSPSLFGQTEELYRPQLSVKYNPLAFIAYTPGIELGLERAIGKDASIHLGGSYLNDFNINASQNFSGYKVIGEYRFYSPFSAASNNHFVGLIFNFKKVIARGQTYINQANGNYQELIALTVDNTSLDFLASIGKVFPLNKWLSIDLAVVVGAKRLSIASDDISDNAFLSISENTLFDFTPNEPGNYWYPVYRMQAKFNFDLK